MLEEDMLMLEEVGVTSKMYIHQPSMVVVDILAAADLDVGNTALDVGEIKSGGRTTEEWSKGTTRGYLPSTTLKVASSHSNRARLGCGLCNFWSHAGFPWRTKLSIHLTCAIRVPMSPELVHEKLCYVLSTSQSNTTTSQQSQTSY
jgi:hypothetical protein